ncbi:UDP-N-acetylmuramoyl-L-alanyl-D-glutamate--2, 6-diaminopimelate ligase [Shewanella amazonensis]|uniref:UDP-N-acetylmuramyl-tripeptide synthetase n=1 Tax=Shewanella amazonensis (strain ATCC BAA-1098 / SB2B) TaxID=326297 RepID=A1S2F4_SHEAM|nr:UDP-N-acetylmuramoyl-L-alanyl-D-glutamate--2,6-diaminopimelate ligase [Shewanella amazonensis]ABL98560.1 UDP-N-acetylmuramoylalanyl-D-glutamate--2,6-diaminopimelate ligase [Shewanella amazonensis SB2B]
MMLLKDLLAPWFHYAGTESVHAPVIDSRQLTAGGLFIAVPGYKTDGRAYLDAAFAKGAAAALVHTDDPDEHGKVSYEPGLCIAFFQLNRQVSAVARQYYALTRGKLRVVGVTGTNGKTSVSQLIAQLTELLGDKAAVMGTLGNGLWGQLQDVGNTTADAVRVMADLYDFEHQGAKVCAMEVSSHGLVQGRVEAVPFEVAVFTNLSRDHLDYHGDMDNYAAAKRRLFAFGSLSARVINLDDKVGEQWFDGMGCATGFSCLGHAKADWRFENAHFHHAGFSANLVWPGGQKPLECRLLGAFNLSNLLAALCAMAQLGYQVPDLVAAAAKLEAVPGRMECFPRKDGVSLVVDYAHTPDAIEQALKAARHHCEGALWIVFGCGGDRDKGKRPLMAEAAEAFADCLVLTSDNARSEDPAVILEDMKAGLDAPERALCMVDRVAAIRHAVSMAKPGDLILLAGKGHETYQEIAGVKHEYDERALARVLSEENL